MRSSLQASTAIPSRIFDAPKEDAPLSRPEPVDIRMLPLIADDALPPLPRGIEARLYQDPAGLDHQIVLWSPVHELAVTLALADKADVADAAAMMLRAMPGRR